MPQAHHVEKHFTSSEFVRDIVIGMADGLTVPFALEAGLFGAVEGTAMFARRTGTQAPAVNALGHPKERTRGTSSDAKEQRWS